MTVLEIVRDASGIPATSTDRLDSLELDSLEFVELIREIEDHFSVLVSDADIIKLQTVKDLEDLVNRQQNSLVRG